MEIAKTILEQLGGNKFMVMTGAYWPMSCNNGLSIRLRTRSPYPNHVQISLNNRDTYDVTFNRLHGLKCKEVSKHEDIYCDSLVELFEKETGLRTSL